MASFIDTLKGNDARIEVIVGQGRLLTLKKESSVGKAVALRSSPWAIRRSWISRSCPILRMIRLMGLRPGVTDLSITTPDGQTHAFEVHVVHDLSCCGPAASGVPRRRNSPGPTARALIVEGQARSINPGGSQIIDTLQAYLEPLSAGIED